MGSDMLAILDVASESVPLILDEVPVWFEGWEQTLSRFRLDSELSCLNRTSDQPTAVSEALWEVFQTAAWADDFSEGFVTPTVLDAMLESGYDRPFDFLSLEQTNWMLPSRVMAQPLSMVVADPVRRTINLPHGVHLDFGGVAKGWAAHQAMERLQKLGPCLMNAGGDISVHGPRLDGNPWEIGVSNPFEAKTDFTTLFVEKGGVATSGKDRRRWNYNGLPQHHIINPLTGQPAETDLLRVTVVAPTVMEAEAAAKTAFILGREKGLEWIEAHPDLAGLLLLETGEVILSQTMYDYL